jgi:hypothetical protein
MPEESLHVQCVYGSSNIAHLQRCLIPSLQRSTRSRVVLATMNYDPLAQERLPSLGIGNVEVIDVVNPAIACTGFAENHNYLFNKFRPSPVFVMLNPDCIVHEGALDVLLERKAQCPSAGLVEGRQWPFEHPKEFDRNTLQTPWSSGAFLLADSAFYQSVGGMYEPYFLYLEDVDLSWQAWLNDYSVLYEPRAVVTHYSGGPFYNKTLVAPEQYLSLRNFIVIARKFFGADGEKKALAMLEYFPDHVLAMQARQEYFETIRIHMPDPPRVIHRHPMVKIVGLNQFHELRVL